MDGRTGGRMDNYTHTHNHKYIYIDIFGFNFYQGLVDLGRMTMSLFYQNQ